MNPGAAQLAVLYHWRLKPGCEDAFVSAWSDVTRELLAAGSLGSRLHRSSDGDWYGYAQWPDAAVRAAAFEKDVAPEASARMRAAIAESLPAVELAPIADYLQPVATAAVTTVFAGES